jgi:hypothetical protein
MKKLTILLLFACSILSAQEYIEYSVLDVSGLAGDTIRAISVKPLGKENSRIVEIDFTDVNCSLLALDIGYGVSDDYPVFLDTIPGVALPVTLDKTTYTSTYRGVENNSVSFDILGYSGNYVWLRIIDNATCTSGDIKIRYSK